ncbi:PAQR family membrane homeostasis protein TrhA [Shewanella surugensis]|uniref:Hemolysin III family protein n=1 Tax=Shewanella surugensis TaxID=212020 RepID=A0ABT0LF58_9GAMM|nr:hemolysin III family protein [Shewanella surugensis]MCL1126338.1 hemolysin III family protein [Shewanella surugensis]
MSIQHLAKKIDHTPPTSKIIHNALPQNPSVGEYSINEERANTLSHGLGVLGGIAALFFSLHKGYHSLTTLQLSGVILYCVSIILLFLCSTLYHNATSQYWKRQFKIADHCAIYILIAGTYTPLMLISLAGTKADLILLVIWLVALGGVFFKTLFTGRFKVLSVCLYLGMGWLSMIIINDLIAGMSPLGFDLFIAGGLFYTLGVIFYVVKAIPFNHAIWHLFVLAGASSHFLCIYLTVI